jgi:uncharacterized membrane protein YkoI
MMAFVRQRGRLVRTGAGVLVCLAVAAGLVTVSAGTSDHGRAGEGDGRGEVVPLQEVLERVHESFDGRILKVELGREGHEKEKPWVYEIKVLTPHGRVLKLEYDARTAELLEVKGRRERGHDDD